MDEIERQMCRARAKWRQRLPGERSLWRFENWSSDGMELHHIARRKFSDTTVALWISMHWELTRRAMEEHPPEASDSNNPLEKSGRLFLGSRDIIDCLGDFLGLAGEERVARAKLGRRDLGESVYRRVNLIALIGIVRQCLDEIERVTVVAI